MENSHIDSEARFIVDLQGNVQDNKQPRLNNHSNPVIKSVAPCFYDGEVSNSQPKAEASAVGFAPTAEIHLKATSFANGLVASKSTINKLFWASVLMAALVALADWTVGLLLLLGISLPIRLTQIREISLRSLKLILSKRNLAIGVGLVVLLIIPVGWPVNLWLIGSISLFALLRTSAENLHPQGEDVSIWKKLGSVITKDMSNVALCISTGGAIVWAIQISFHFFYNDDLYDDDFPGLALWTWEYKVVELRDELEGVLSLSLQSLVLILAGLLLIIWIWPKSKLVTRFAMMRKWGGRALVTLITITMFTFFPPDSTYLVGYVPQAVLGERSGEKGLNAAENKRDVLKLAKELAEELLNSDEVKKALRGAHARNANRNYSQNELREEELTRLAESIAEAVSQDWHHPWSEQSPPVNWNTSSAKDAKQPGSAIIEEPMDVTINSDPVTPEKLKQSEAALNEIVKDALKSITFSFVEVDEELAKAFTKSIIGSLSKMAITGVFPKTEAELALQVTRIKNKLNSGADGLAKSNRSVFQNVTWHPRTWGPVIKEVPRIVFKEIPRAVRRLPAPHR